MSHFASSSSFFPLRVLSLTLYCFCSFSLFPRTSGDRISSSPTLVPRITRHASECLSPAVCLSVCQRQELARGDGVKKRRRNLSPLSFSLPLMLLAISGVPGRFSCLPSHSLSLFPCLLFTVEGGKTRVTPTQRLSTGHPRQQQQRLSSSSQSFPFDSPPSPASLPLSFLPRLLRSFSRLRLHVLAPLLPLSFIFLFHAVTPFH